MNDVDRIDDGRYLVSVRNKNQLLIIEQGDGVVDVVNENQSTAVLDHQHNPQYLGDGRVLVADSENDRVVELKKQNGTWTPVWTVDSANGIPFNWPRDADRLPNGHTIITDTRNNRLVEVDNHGDTVWTQGTVNIPYVADRLPHQEQSGNLTSAASTTGQETSVNPIITISNRGLGLLRHIIPVPYWVTWAHLLSWVLGVPVLLSGVGLSFKRTRFSRLREGILTVRSHAPAPISIDHRRPAQRQDEN